MQEPTENSSSSASPDTTALDSTTVSTPEAISATPAVEEATTPAGVSETAVADTAVASVSAVATDSSAAVSTPVTPTPSKLSPVVKQYAIAGAIVLVMGVALWYMLEEQGRVQTGVFDNIKSLVMPEPVAVTVNGEKVPQSLYQKNFDQLAAQAAAQGADATDPAVAEQIKKQTVDVLVNSALLRQAARNAGVVVTEEQITARYQAIVESQGGEEALTARMAELAITKEALMQDINDEILIQTHLAAAVDTSAVTITDAEVEALYSSVASNPAVDVPPLTEVRPQIEQEIRYGKEQELISAYIETLKKDVQIEVLI